VAEILRVARKEFRGFFASPAAFLFLGAFLGVTLFVFFWVDAFFARNIADVRPLFQWMPVLLIFLVAALTMRAWSEERRSGTLESLLTAPVRPLTLVLGKFSAALALVALALVLTLPLPITVAFLGPRDWGPVVGLVPCRRVHRHRSVHERAHRQPHRRTDSDGRGLWAVLPGRHRYPHQSFWL
jgi:ABC-2 type transport system permease protein